MSGEQHTLDINYDGRADVWLADDMPGDDFATREVIDRNLDGIPDLIYTDSDGNGYADGAVVDNNLDGAFDDIDDVTGDGISMDRMDTTDPWAVAEHETNQLFHE